MKKVSLYYYCAAAIFCIITGCSKTPTAIEPASIKTDNQPVLPYNNKLSTDNIKRDGAAYIGIRYKIINKNSGKVLQVTDAAVNNGISVTQWADNGSTAQQWTFKDAGEGYYKIENINSGKVLDILTQSKTNGAALVQWDYNGGLNQQWKMESQRDGFFRIVNRNSSKALDVVNSSSADGAKVSQWDSNSGANQTWQLVPITSRELLWADEFNYNGKPDSKYWDYEKGFVRNKEKQYYTNNNANCNGNDLVIEGRKNDAGHEYTSSSIITSGKVSFSKGYFEMRAKIPTAAGMWPAWWVLGIHPNGWPYCGEIDMMEYYNNKLLFNVMNSKSQWKSITKALPSGFSNQYHVWGMRIDDNYIRLYLDGVEMNTYPQSQALNGTYNPFLSNKLYMLVNLALGGNNGGDPSKTSFPQRYAVDYIRYFSL